MAYTRITYRDFICDTRADVATLPTQNTQKETAPFGARCLIIDDNGEGAAVVMLDSTGQWKDL